MKLQLTNDSYNEPTRNKVNSNIKNRNRLQDR